MIAVANTESVRTTKRLCAAAAIAALLAWPAGPALGQTAVPSTEGHYDERAAYQAREAAVEHGRALEWAWRRLKRYIEEESASDWRARVWRARDRTPPTAELVLEVDRNGDGRRDRGRIWLRDWTDRGLRARHCEGQLLVWYAPSRLRVIGDHQRAIVPMIDGRGRRAGAALQWLESGAVDGGPLPACMGSLPSGRAVRYGPVVDPHVASETLTRREYSAASRACPPGHHVEDWDRDSDGDGEPDLRVTWVRDVSVTVNGRGEALPGTRSEGAWQPLANICSRDYGGASGRPARVERWAEACSWTLPDGGTGEGRRVWRRTRSAEGREVAEPLTYSERRLDAIRRGVAVSPPATERERGQAAAWLPRPEHRTEAAVTYGAPALVANGCEGAVPTAPRPRVTRNDGTENRACTTARGPSGRYFSGGTMSRTKTTWTLYRPWENAPVVRVTYGQWDARSCTWDGRAGYDRYVADRGGDRGETPDNPGERDTTPGGIRDLGGDGPQHIDGSDVPGLTGPDCQSCHGRPQDFGLPSAPRDPSAPGRGSTIGDYGVSENAPGGHDNDRGGWGGDETGFDTCFTADTPVLMADGTEKPIEDVRVGDLVMSFDENGPADGPLRANEVTAVHKHQAAGYLVIDGTLQVTPNHPLLTPGGFVEARTLSIGDRLVTADGTASEITGIAVLGVPSSQPAVPVFNITVARDHTYVAGGYRVHNK